MTAKLHCLLPQKWLTKWCGFLANIQTPWLKNLFIRYFIRHYQVNMAEAIEEIGDNYPNFNAFFTRHLKPDCRPLASADIISPVDGFLSEFGMIQQGTLLQAKGLSYTVQELLGMDDDVCRSFEQGHYATFYLSPRDYHRIHMPLKGQVQKMLYCPGKLFSVKAAIVERIPKVFARNERLVIFFDTPQGPMAMVLVGAVIVGAIGVHWHGEIARDTKQHLFEYHETPPILLEQGDEVGYFKLGSTVILLFPKTTPMHWDSHLEVGDSLRFGQAIGGFE